MTKLYRPSNGTEGESFIEHWCGNCARDAAYREGTGDSCPIVAASLAYNINDPNYPKEWICDDDGCGNPRCTAFTSETPAYRCEGTMDLFDARPLSGPGVE